MRSRNRTLRRCPTPDKRHSAASQITFSPSPSNERPVGALENEDERRPEKQHWHRGPAREREVRPKRQLPLAPRVVALTLLNHSLGPTAAAAAPSDTATAGSVPKDLGGAEEWRADGVVAARAAARRVAPHVTAWLAAARVRGVAHGGGGGGGGGVVVPGRFGGGSSAGLRPLCPRRPRPRRRRVARCALRDDEVGNRGREREVPRDLWRATSEWQRPS